MATADQKKLLQKYVSMWQKIDEAVQVAYDKATKHGTEATTQADWEAKYKQFADDIAKENGWTK